jgi:hypothetical protein
MYLGALGAAFLSAGLLAVPSAALADTSADPVKVVGLVELDDAGKTVQYPIHQGEEVPVVIGVADVGTAPTKVVVNIRVVDDVDLPKTFDNCWYYVDSNLEGAWCEFDRELAVGETYEASPFRIAVAPDARPNKLSAIMHGWFSESYAQQRGGIEALAKRDSGKGTTPAKGTEATLRLQPKKLTIPADAVWIGFAGIKLVTPPSSTPVTTPPTSGATPSAGTTPSAGASSSAGASAGVTPSISATPVPGGGGGSDDGGLPVTGAKAATMAGGGAVLLIAGLVGFLLARRRRTRFVA